MGLRDMRCAQVKPRCRRGAPRTRASIFSITLVATISMSSVFHQYLQYFVIYFASIFSRFATIFSISSIYLIIVSAFYQYVVSMFSIIKYLVLVFLYTVSQVVIICQ